MSDNAISTETLWELISGKLRSFLRRRVPDDHTAEDLLQETFVRVHQKVGDLDDQQRISAWIFRIARNLVTDYYRSKSRCSTGLADEIEANLEEENLNEVVAGWLPQMISQLPEDYRHPVELYELEGVSQQEIAHRMGLSLSAAKSRVQRGRERLRLILLECCSFERDLRGNIIDFAKNVPRCDCDECGQ